jgi:antibiotic biosynthesis monooxygenase (ABM) superfamily enzyme
VIQFICSIAAALDDFVHRIAPIASDRSLTIITSLQLEFLRSCVMLDPLVVGTDEDTHQVTAIISHFIRPGREQGYEEWLHGIATAAHQFKGHLGVNVIRPRDPAHPEYVAILRFDHYNNLKTWLESSVRQEWLERLQPLIEKPETIQTLTGLETWFTLPNKPMKAPPPRYKMAIVTWLGVFFTISILNRLLVPLLAELPVLLRTLLVTLLFPLSMICSKKPALAQIT